MGRTEEHHVRLELGDVAFDPRPHPRGGPHEGPVAPHHAGVVTLVGRRQHPDRIRVGGHQVAEVLLDAARLGRIVVGDEEHAHRQYPITP